MRWRSRTCRRTCGAANLFLRRLSGVFSAPPERRPIPSQSASHFDTARLVSFFVWGKPVRANRISFRAHDGFGGMRRGIERTSMDRWLARSNAQTQASRSMQHSRQPLCRKSRRPDDASRGVGEASGTCYSPTSRWLTTSPRAPRRQSVPTLFGATKWSRAPRCRPFARRPRLPATRSDP